PATMEFGIGLFKANGTDGCQHNTITNCRIKLNRVNNASGTGPAADGSRGIEMINATTSAHTSSVNVSAMSGSHAYNTFRGNVIENCNTGISLNGFAGSSPYALCDHHNHVGDSLGGNTIINFGGGGT